MRYLIISDIHGNLAAFEAVLQHATGYDKIWCLGDMVGYGPDPRECIERLRPLNHVCVAGNHDWAVLGKLDLEDFNPDARYACMWSREQLRPEDLTYLEALPQSVVEDGFTLVHGSPRQPIWEYILYPSIARPNFTYFGTQCCLVGHTHTPIIFRLRQSETIETCDALPVPYNGSMLIAEDRLIINPGSVGQPRDGDARASYLILDTEQRLLEFHRIPYPIEETQARMKERQFPPRLIARLGYGW